MTDRYGTVDTSAGPTIAVVPPAITLSLSIDSIYPTVVEAGMDITLNLTVEARLTSSWE